MIRINNLSKSFDDKKIFSSVNLTIEASKIVLIHGISGSGKTTLLNMIAGLEQVSGGEILIEDRSVVFQDASLLKEYIYYSSIENDLIINSKVIDNLLLINSHEEFIDNLLNEFQLKKYKYKKVSKLSKGERERISLVKALLSNKKIILFDEPTANLDKENAILFIKALNKYLNKRIVIICSHDYQLLKDYVDELYVLKNNTLIKENTLNKYNEETAAIEYKTPQKANIFTKIALTKVFRRKVFLGFNLFFLFLFLSSVFFTISYGMVDLNQYRLSFVNQYVEDDDYLIAYFSFRRAQGPLVKTLSENHKIYFEYLSGSSIETPDLGTDLEESESNSDFRYLDISIIDFDDDLVFSAEFDDSNIDNYLPVIINENQKNFIEKYFDTSVNINSLMPYTSGEKQLIVANVVEDYKDDLETKNAFKYFPVFTSLDYLQDLLYEEGIYFSFGEYYDLTNEYLSKYEFETDPFPYFQYLIPFSILEKYDINYTLFNGSFSDTDFLISNTAYDAINLVDNTYPEDEKLIEFFDNVDLFKETIHPNLNASYSLNGYFDLDNPPYIVISDVVYNKIIENLYEGYYLPFYSNCTTYISKEFLLNNVEYMEFIYENYTYVHRNALNSLFNEIDAFDDKQNMFAIFSYILLGLFIVLFSVYFILIFIDIRRDGSILLLNGYSIKDIFKLIGIYLSIIFTFGFIFWVCFTPLLIYIIQIFDNPFGYTIVTNIPIPVIISFAIVVGIVLIYSMSSLLIKKEKMFDIIKNT